MSEDAMKNIHVDIKFDGKMFQELIKSKLQKDDEFVSVFIKEEDNKNIYVQTDKRIYTFRLLDFITIC